MRLLREPRRAPCEDGAVSASSSWSLSPAGLPVRSRRSCRRVLARTRWGTCCGLPCECPCPAWTQRHRRRPGSPHRATLTPTPPAPARRGGAHGEPAARARRGHDPRRTAADQRGSLDSGRCRVRGGTRADRGRNASSDRARPGNPVRAAGTFQTAQPQGAEAGRTSAAWSRPVKYATGSAFRAAIEDRLSDLSEPERVRRRKAIAFDRFLARLASNDQDLWLVKGGVALEMRFGGLARATRDLDLGWAKDADAIDRAILAVSTAHVVDHFIVTVERDDESPPADQLDASRRYRARVEIGGRLFEEFVIDASSEHLGFPGVGISHEALLGFAEITATNVPFLPLEQHIAEKFHAYTRTYQGGRRSSRVKDLGDPVLIASHSRDRLAMGELRRAIDRTFEARATRLLPSRLDQPPMDWAVPYRRLAADVDLPGSIGAGFRVAESFLNPVPGPECDAGSIWEAETVRWLPASAHGTG